jgi:hypothetical protein
MIYVNELRALRGREWILWRASYLECMCSGLLKKYNARLLKALEDLYDLNCCTFLCPCAAMQATSPISSIVLPGLGIVLS